MQREEEEGGQGVKELFHAVVEIKSVGESQVLQVS
jgi:hypothetical protein